MLHLESKLYRGKTVSSLSIGLLGLHLTLGSYVIANPTGGNVTHGAADISSAGSTLNVNQLTDKAIINWDSFSIAQGETTQFDQLSATSAVLNRVVGGDISKIYGNLKANGQVFLINGNGVLIGATGVIDTAGFLATTHSFNNEDFLDGGDLRLEPGTKSSGASIINLGKISASGGDIFLIADHVTNEGIITASSGSVGLAAARGSRVLLAESGDQRILIQPSTAAKTDKDGVINKGTITAVNAEIKAAGGNIYALAINNDGVVRATGVQKKGGRILLTSKAGKIKLGKSSDLNVSGEEGGGKINVGGNKQGQGMLATAQQVDVEQGSKLTADAIESGNGGTIIVFAEGNTTIAGEFSSRGGKTIGDGGFIETSGKQNLLVSNSTRVNTSASRTRPSRREPAVVNGDSGTWLLNSTNFTISGSGVSAMESSIEANTLNQNLNSTSVMIVTDNDGTEIGDIVVNAEVNWGRKTDLTLTAHRDIVVNKTIIGGENITLTAGDGADGARGGNIVIQTGARISADGSVALTSGNAGSADDTAGKINGFIDIESLQNLTLMGEIVPMIGSSLTLHADGELSLTHDLPALTGALSLRGRGYSPTTALSASGGIRIDAGLGDLLLNQALTSSAGSIELHADGHIEVNENFVPTFSDGESLTLRAGRDLTVNQAITNTGTGDIILMTGTLDDVDGQSGGNIIVNSGASLSTGGNLSLTASRGVEGLSAEGNSGDSGGDGTDGGSLIINADLTSQASLTLTAGDGGAGAGGLGGGLGGNGGKGGKGGSLTINAVLTSQEALTLTAGLGGAGGSGGSGSFTLTVDQVDGGSGGAGGDGGSLIINDSLNSQAALMLTSGSGGGGGFAGSAARSRDSLGGAAGAGGKGGSLRVDAALTSQKNLTLTAGDGGAADSAGSGRSERSGVTGAVGGDGGSLIINNTLASQEDLTLTTGKGGLGGLDNSTNETGDTGVTGVINGSSIDAQSATGDLMVDGRIMPADGSNLTLHAGPDGKLMLFSHDLPDLKGSLSLRSLDYSPVSELIALGGITLDAGSGNMVLNQALNSSGGSILLKAGGKIDVNEGFVPTLDSAGSLTLLAGKDLTLNSGIQLDSTADLNLVAGWDGTTVFDAPKFDAIDVNLVATLYGNSNGSIFIADGTQTSGIGVGSRNGNTRVYGHNITLQAGSGDDGRFAQLGFQVSNERRDYTISGGLSARALNDITAQGGANNSFNYAQIGHVGADRSSTNNDVEAVVNSPITILAGNDLSFLAGVGEQAYAQIGHGGVFAGGAYSGEIDVTASGDLTLTGQDVAEKYTQLGHGGNSLTLGNSNVLVRAGGDANLTNVYLGHLVTIYGAAADTYLGVGGKLVFNEGVSLQTTNLAPGDSPQPDSPQIRIYGEDTMSGVEFNGSPSLNGKAVNSVVNVVEGNQFFGEGGYASAADIQTNGNFAFYNLKAVAYDYEVGAAEAAQIVTALGSGEVTLDTKQGLTDFGARANYFSTVNYINVNSRIVYDSTNNLNLLATGDITFNDSVRNVSVTSGGELNLIAGWDGTTGFNATDFDAVGLNEAASLYGNNNGSVFIGTGTQTAGISVGSRNGTTRAYGRDLNILAGTGGNGRYAQLGLQVSDQGDGYKISGGINARVLHNINATGGATNEFNYAQLGHLGADQDAGGEIAAAVDAPITIAAGNNLNFIAGGGDYAYSQLGHGGYVADGNHTGNITITSSNDLSFSAGSGFVAYSQLGHGGNVADGNHTGNITITSSNDLSFSAGSKLGAYSQLGHGGVGAAGTRKGNITVASTGEWSLVNGSGDTWVIGHITTSDAAVSNADIHLTAGTIDNVVGDKQGEDAILNADFARQVSRNLSGGNVTLNITGANGNDGKVSVDSGFSYNTANTFTITSTKDLIFTTDGSIENLGTGEVILSTQVFSNQAGSSALSINDGRWLIYAKDVIGNTFGGLKSDNQAIWNTSYSSKGPTQAGNRYLFENQPTLTVTATDSHKTYGDNVTASIMDDFTVTGFVDAFTYESVFTQDTVANSFSTDPVVTSLGAEAGAVVKKSGYDLNVSATTSTGYGLTLKKGTLTVAKKALIIRKVSAANKEYDGTNTASLSGGVLEGLTNSDTGGFIAGSATFTTANAGTHSVTAREFKLNDATSENYTLSAQPIIVDATINKRALTVTANNAVKVYDGLAFKGGNGVSFSGFIEGEDATNLTGDIGYGGTAQNAIDTGNYEIGVSGLSSGNYTISYEEGGLTISQRALVVTANDATRVFGTELMYSGSVTGLIAADGIGVDYESNSAVSTLPGLYLAGNPLAVRPVLSDPNNRLSNYAVSLKGGSLRITDTEREAQQEDFWSWVSREGEFFGGVSTELIEFHYFQGNLKQLRRLLNLEQQSKKGTRKMTEEERGKLRELLSSQPTVASSQ